MATKGQTTKGLRQNELLPSRKNEEKSHAKTQRRKETRLSQVLDGSRLLPTGGSSICDGCGRAPLQTSLPLFCDLCAFSRLFRFFCLQLCGFAPLREIFRSGGKFPRSWCLCGNFSAFRGCVLKFVKSDLSRRNAEFGEHLLYGFNHHGRTAKIILDGSGVRMVPKILLQNGLVNEAG